MFELDGWEPYYLPCFECEQEDLVFTLSLRPLADPHTAILCLRCGAIATAHLGESGPFMATGGGDWAEPSEAVRSLRRALRDLTDDQVWDFG